MAFFCGRSKTKDEDIYRNVSLEKRISQTKSEDMDLSNMNLTDDDIPLINRKVIQKKKYSSLSLANNQITAYGVQNIVAALKINPKITHLILSSNPIGDRGIYYITDLIENSRTIYHLSLADTNLTDHSLQSISRVLTSSSIPLRCLDLRSNHLITDLSVDSLLYMVDKNNTLSACRLDNCGLTQQGKDRLKEAKSIRW